MYPVLIAAAVVAFDQIIKNILTKALASGPITVVKNFFNLVYVENYGIAFGMFKNKVMFFIVTNCIISVVMAFMIYKFRFKSIPVTVCLSLILGGAIGNLIDRIRLGYVIDYLSFTIFPPVFNLADSAIVVGAILLSLLLVFNKDISI
ncbi:MAG: signal peptidase II [Clostridiaceae bacterium]|nr:signal peptidase II [Clostridiaceae bacterium]